MENDKEKELIEKTGKNPITHSGISADLEKLGVEPGMFLLVHSSMSSLGWVCGGAAAVIQALEDTVRPYGLIVMPAHSGDLSDPSGWNNPPVPESWYDSIRETMPAYNPDITPTRGIGVVAELFRTFPYVMRSMHPQVSFAAWGEKALDIVSDHELDFSMGNSSPLGKLYEENAYILHIGTQWDTNTAFHLAEYRYYGEVSNTAYTWAPVEIHGHRRWKRFIDTDYDSSDFLNLGEDYEKKMEHEIKTGKIGLAQSRLFPMQSCVDFAVNWFKRHRQ